MSKNLWDDDEFRDGAPAMENGKWVEAETYTPAPDDVVRANKIREAQKQAASVYKDDEEIDLEELTDQVAQEEDDDYTEVMSDARLRLEQGKLYEMVMNHNLFDGVDADPRAIKSVQKQIRKLAKELMETMLGMRQEQTVANNAIVSSPFNDLEVQVLKKLASAASKGATEAEEAQVVTQPNPIAPKKTTLNTIGSSKPKQQAKPQAKPIAKAQPIQRKAQTKRELPPEFEPDYNPLDKPVYEMTADELVERDRQALDRQKGRKAALPADRAPMPDYGTMEAMALSQTARATTPGRNNLSALIVANLKGSGKI